MFMMHSFSGRNGKSAELPYDIVLHNAVIYDGTGSEPYVGQVGVRGDKIAYVGTTLNVDDALGNNGDLQLIDCEGKSLAPGFINMLSWAPETLLVDGRSLSDLLQGVTLEVMGESVSFGPWNDRMKEENKAAQTHMKWDIEWTTLGEYLEHLAKKGVSCNVASFLGTSTVRENFAGRDPRAFTEEEFKGMEALIDTAMQEGAMGVSSALIYPPDCSNTTEDLTFMAKCAAKHGGMYISHLRSEGDKILEALDEFVTIAREAKCDAEVYHIKVAGRENWPKLDSVIAKITQAQNEGLNITADLYPYTAGYTNLVNLVPHWALEGGPEKFFPRLEDEENIRKLVEDIQKPYPNENLYLLTGAQYILPVNFLNPDKVKEYSGLNLVQIHEKRGTEKSPEETLFKLLLEEKENLALGVILFMGLEENVTKFMKIPWISFCSDAESLCPEGAFLKMFPHPRAYGSFASILGQYCRDQQVIPLAEAIRKLTSLPAKNLKIKERGQLCVGYYADLVLFDAATINANSTYTEPHKLATGVRSVFVNGVQVVRDGQHTGKFPGRVVYGPGKVNK